MPNRLKNPVEVNESKLVLAKKILNTLGRQDFADWYGFVAEGHERPPEGTARFDDFFTGAYPKGDERRPTEESILLDIIRLFGL